MVMKKSEFKYYDSPLTTFKLIDEDLIPKFDDKHNTVTFHNEFEVENLTGKAVDNVTAVLPYIWAVAPGDGSLGPAGLVALDFEHNAWTTEDFNGIKGLDLKVTAKMVPLDHHYNTGKIAAGKIASDVTLTDDFGPSSTDDPVNAPFPPETLDKDDQIPSVNLGRLKAHEDVTLDLVFTYKWTLDGKKADYDALNTAGAINTLDPVENSHTHHSAPHSSADYLWFV
jgi:hypothetical protein